MNIFYCVNITDPHLHLVEVILKGKKHKDCNQLTFFLPSWSPGSYLMREYAKNIRWFKAQTAKGEPLYFEQCAKGQWAVDWQMSEVNEKEEFEIRYSIYCHELTVRTSHIDSSHAFLHGPSVLMGVKDVELKDPSIQLNFQTTGWTKVSTGLKDISNRREDFIYSAPDYDTLIDAPIEIGSHITDGFRIDGKDHNLAFYGPTLKHNQNLKEDIKTIVTYVSDTMGEIPYDDYTFITHFIPGQYGGLEHLNSTALIFDGTRLNERKSYLKWLELVAHEYFHTWNVKRIRPKELGPFDYTSENYTTMLWLAEGLTSFMDQLFVYRCGLMSAQEYMDAQKENLNNYYAIPGRKFHSLEASSFNAWVKLYRPDENTSNSSISYYLKGGLVFFVLHVLLHEHGKDMNDLLELLWNRYKENPAVGVDSAEVYQMIEGLTDADVRSKFEEMIEVPSDPDFELYLNKTGVEIEWDQPEQVWLGFNTESNGDKVIIKNVILDGPAFKDGLNAGDEIIAIDNIRVTQSNLGTLINNLVQDRYEVLVSRCGFLQRVTIAPEKKPREIKNLKIADEEKFKQFYA